MSLKLLYSGISAALGGQDVVRPVGVNCVLSSIRIGCLYVGSNGSAEVIPVHAELSRISQRKTSSFEVFGPAFHCAESAASRREVDKKFGTADPHIPAYSQLEQTSKQRLEPFPTLLSHYITRL